MPNGLLKKRVSDEQKIRGSVPPGTDLMPKLRESRKRKREPRQTRTTFGAAEITKTMEGFDTRRDPFIQPQRPTAAGPVAPAATATAGALTAAPTATGATPFGGVGASPFGGGPTEAPVEEPQAISVADLIEQPEEAAAPEQGMNWESIAYALGKAGEAIMGPFETSWQAKLGRAGAQMAQERAFSRFSTALERGEEGDPRDASILTSEQRVQARGMADVIERAKIERESMELDIEVRREELEERRVERTERIAELERVGISAEVKVGLEEKRIAVPEKVAEIRKGADITVENIRAGARGTAAKESLRRWEETFERAGQEAGYRRAERKAKAAADAIDDPDRWASVFDEIMERELGEDYIPVGEEGESWKEFQ